MQISGPKSSLILGQVADFAEDPTFESEEDTDAILMRFDSAEKAGEEKLKSFLKEHLTSLSELAAESK